MSTIVVIFHFHHVSFVVFGFFVEVRSFSKVYSMAACGPLVCRRFLKCIASSDGMPPE